ncbi:hypothetical protein B566_EDAN009710 [Ephemera danica]|nr:hypothetical protein B566_EDAN009710 [Ephemera danica]
MGIQDLQAYIQTMAPGAAVSVDLLRIARNKKSQPGRKLKLVMDAECCLDRLYGGYFSDWASGGQWNRMVQFLSILCQHLAVSGIELVVFFNGSLETGRVGQWAAQQQITRQNVSAVFRHLASKGTPPPKICTMDDHKQEVIAYCRENNFHGLLVEDAEYAAFDPPRYFSSENLKLTYKGSLETKEYLLARVAETLQISPGRLPLLAALLGTHLLGEDELAEFYRRGVAGFIKGLGASADDMDQVAAQVFGGPAVGGCEAGRAGRLRSATQYYLNGTKEGFLKYKAPNKGARNNQKGKGKNKTDNSKPAEPETTLKFASETAESERDSLAAYKEATANSTQLNPEIVVEPPGAMGETSETDAHSNTLVNGVSNGVSSLHLSNSSSSSNSNAASPSHNPSPQQQGDSMVWTPAQPPQPKIEEMTGEARMASLVSAEVLRTAAERHQKGLMTPSIYQILTQGVIKLPTVLEDEQHKEFPSAHHFYRPVRQMVYGILFNLHHLTYIQNHKDGKEDQQQQQQPQQPMPDPESIVIREWVWSKSNQYARPEVVKPEKVGWGVPTIQRLWFGSAHSSTIDDKRRRLRAFLSCMRSDTPLMLNPTHVPQPMLIFACVIRYMMSFPDRGILRKHELDALIAQAHAPELMNATYLQDLQVNWLLPLC